MTFWWRLESERSRAGEKRNHKFRALEIVPTIYSEVPNRQADRKKQAGLEKNASLLAYLPSKSIRAWWNFSFITWKIASRVDRKSEKIKWVCSSFRDFRVWALMIWFPNEIIIFWDQSVPSQFNLYFWQARSKSIWNWLIRSKYKMTRQKNFFASSKLNSGLLLHCRPPN